MSAGGLIARQSVRLVLRENTVALMAGLFVVMVLISAWLGWQATATVNRIYLDAAAFLLAAGKPVPGNPVLDTSPLTLMRNVPVYVSLIGALVAIVIANRLVALDRRAGVLPLIGSRPVAGYHYATGKITALCAVLTGLMLVALAVSVATLFLLPAIAVTGAEWLGLLTFYAVSLGYVLIFGLTAMASAAWARTESVGLLVPVTVWLAVTFILPAMTSNLTPTATLNPISALATPPDTGFFNWTAWLFGPLSPAEAYGAIAAKLLDYLPVGWQSRSLVPALPTLALILCVGFGLAALALSSLAKDGTDYDA